MQKNYLEAMLERALKKGYILNQDFGFGLAGKLRTLFKHPKVYTGWVAIQLGFMPKGEIEGQLFWGKSLILPRDDKSSFLLAKSGYLGDISEVSLTKFIIRNLKSGEIFYDIGANYGFYSYLTAELVGPEGQVHVFEPAPETFRYLQKNLAKAENVYLNQCAVFSTDGERTFFDTSVSHLSGRGSLIDKTVASIPSTQIKVKTLTIDSYIRTNKKPTFIKIDAEGAEFEIIQGGINFLRENSPIIAMEVWGNSSSESLSRPAVQTLLSLNYRAFYLQDNGELNEYNKEQMNDFINKNEIKNFIFKK